MKKITAKFNSTCAETGRKLSKGSVIYYDPAKRKAYHPESNKAKQFEAGSQQEHNPDAWITEALENAYYGHHN